MKFKFTSNIENKVKQLLETLKFQLKKIVIILHEFLEINKLHMYSHVISYFLCCI